MSLRPIARVRQSLLENPNKTTSSADESLPSFARPRQDDADKTRHSEYLVSAAGQQIFFPENRLATFDFSTENSKVRLREMRMVHLLLTFFIAVRLLSVCFSSPSVFSLLCLHTRKDTHYVMRETLRLALHADRKGRQGRRLRCAGELRDEGAVVPMF